MKKYKIKQKGFVLLFTMILVSITLSIALGLSSIASKENLFSTSARASNDAYYAADTGVECALYWDVGPNGSLYSVAGGLGNPISTYCSGNFINISTPGPTWTFILLGLGPDQKGCAVVTMDQTNPLKRITSKGYNLGGDAQQYCSLDPFIAGRIERIIQVTY